jgi:hypothetical protein
MYQYLKVMRAKVILYILMLCPKNYSQHTIPKYKKPIAAIKSTGSINRLKPSLSQLNIFLSPFRISNKRQELTPNFLTSACNQT